METPKSDDLGIRELMITRISEIGAGLDPENFKLYEQLVEVLNECYMRNEKSNTDTVAQVIELHGLCCMSILEYARDPQTLNAFFRLTLGLTDIFNKLTRIAIILKTGIKETLVRT